MIQMAKGTLRKIVKEQRGQALPIVLVLLVIGGLLVAPCLGYVSTTLKVGQMYEERMAELYAADSGGEDALWKIIHDSAVQAMEYDDPPITYNLNDQVNNKVVTVTIDKRWLLEGLEEYHPGMTPHSDWAVVGRVKDSGVYEVEIVFAPRNEQGEPIAGNRRLERIGVWLPTGFAYAGSSSGITTNDPNNDHNRGGIVLTWDWAKGKGPQFKTNPAQGHWPDVKTQVFSFTPIDRPPEGDFAWVRFGPKDIYLSWDENIFNFNIVSKARDTPTSEGLTQIESNVTKKPDSLAVITWEFSLQ